MLEMLYAGAKGPVQVFSCMDIKTKQLAGYIAVYRGMNGPLCNTFYNAAVRAVAAGDARLREMSILARVMAQRNIFTRLWEKLQWQK